MINNRQGGRRRGRGGQRGQNLGGQPGNRSDNRQRGNAAQLLEKYKNMARDAQLSGDRVQGEYYLQFADHYFRVLNENRARFEEQRRNRDDNGDDEDVDDETVEASEDKPEENRRPRGNGRDRSRKNGKQPEGAEGGETDERIAVEALPPAIGREGEDEAKAEEKPRRRTRRPRAESGGDEAGAAPAA